MAFRSLWSVGEGKGCDRRYKRRKNINSASNFLELCRGSCGAASGHGSILILSESWAMSMHGHQPRSTWDSPRRLSTLGRYGAHAFAHCRFGIEARKAWGASANAATSLLSTSALSSCMCIPLPFGSPAARHLDYLAAPVRTDARNRLGAATASHPHC